MKSVLGVTLAAMVGVVALAGTSASATAAPYWGYPGYPPYHHPIPMPFGPPGPSGFFFGFGHGHPGYYHAPRYHHPRAPSRFANRHVQWCLNRYKTYNPATNTYFRKRGVAAVCVSPFSR